MTEIVVGTLVRCINAEPFPGNKVGPPLELDKQYPVKRIYYEEVENPPDQSDKSYPHYDVGLVSEYNYITSQDTGAELPDGDKVHWCHPSRFVLV